VADADDQRNTASPAATSHSLSGVKRAYTSARPSASQQNLSELPTAIRSPTGQARANASSSAERCDRLSSIRRGVPGAGGRL
jgi:hypothetical protein